jgi:hypothetical protein
MTRNPRPTPSHRRGGLFRAGAHVVAVHCGGGLAILDLERGTLHAATPDGADAWRVLIEGPEAQTEAPLDERGSSGHESRAVLAWVADYLIGRRLIEPSNGETERREVGRAT